VSVRKALAKAGLVRDNGVTAKVGTDPKMHGLPTNQAHHGKLAVVYRCLIPLLKNKWIIVLLFVAIVILVLVFHKFWECPAALTIVRRDVSSTPSSFEEATDTCVSDRGSHLILVLRVSDSSLSIGSEPIGEAQLPRRLQEIYATRAERVLYLLSDKEASFRRVVDVANVVWHLRAESVSPVPKELQSPTDELMNIQIKLVTTQAMNAPCPKGYFNWATQGFPVMP